jgi:hypothetical protein
MRAQRKQKRAPVARLAKAAATMVMPADRNGWVPAPKIRRLLGDISPVTFWRWRHNPRLGFPPGRRITGRWYFQWGAVLDWHAKQSEAA